MISGDGVFHEFLTGLASRPDFKNALSLPLSLMGAGSANALAKNLDCPFPALGMLNIFQGIFSLI